MARDKDRIIQFLATKYNLPLKKIKQIVEYQFKFVTKKMKAGKFETIRLPYFGKFTVNRKRLAYIKKLSKNNK